MALLRDPKFQDLLVNFERKKKNFLVGYGVEDDVSSAHLFNTSTESGLKPEGYLSAFSKFVKENETAIDAISILLNRPKNWNTQALNELKSKLKENSFQESELREAHKFVYQKDMVDIISMIKHAANATEPLLSIEDRVSLAMQKVTKGKLLNYDQLQWIGYIHQHLKQNMTLDENDLQELPVFTDRGGFKKFQKVFAGDYKNLIADINREIAA